MAGTPVDLTLVAVARVRFTPAAVPRLLSGG